jgi:DNA-binding CsgD family transcriptional regulator
VEARAYDLAVLDQELSGGSRLDLRRLLSPREAQVLHMASLGQTNAQVAAGLGVSVHAVKFHLASVYRKLGVANRTEAALAYHVNASRPIQSNTSGKSE